MKLRFWSRNFYETSTGRIEVSSKLESKFHRNFLTGRIEVSSKLRLVESKFHRSFDETSTGRIEVSSKFQ